MSNGVPSVTALLRDLVEFGRDPRHVWPVPAEVSYLREVGRILGLLRAATPDADWEDLRRRVLEAPADSKRFADALRDAERRLDGWALEDRETPLVRQDGPEQPGVFMRHVGNAVSHGAGFGFELRLPADFFEEPPGFSLRKVLGQLLTAYRAPSYAYPDRWDGYRREAEGLLRLVPWTLSDPELDDLRPRLRSARLNTEAFDELMSDIADRIGE